MSESEVVGQNSDVHFGAVDAPLPDWRSSPATYDDEDPDDEELEHTPDDVTLVLGFDPKELSDAKTVTECDCDDEHA